MASIFQKIAKATGQSVDDVMEYFGKKAGAAPSVPMGSGKNLDALKQAKIGAPDATDIGKYPKNIQQDELAARGGFTLEGGPQTKDFTMPHPEATVPTVRGNTLPSVVGDLVEESPEFMAPMLRQSDDVIEATATKIPDDLMSKFKRMDPRLAGIAATMGLGLGGIAMMGEDELPKVAEEFPKSQPTVPQDTSLSQTQALSQSMTTPQPQVTSAVPQVAQEAPKDKSVDYMSMMLNAQRDTSDNQFNNALLRAANQAGAAIAGLGAGAQVKPDYSGVEALDKNADQSVRNTSKLMETQATESKLQKMEKELQDDNKLRDPNSSVSKLVKEVLARHGLKVSSAQEAKNAGINVQNIILQEMASKDRKEIAEMQLKASQAKKQNQLSDAQRKFAQSLRKELTSGTLGKQYSTFATGQRMQNALEQFAKNPTGYSDYATLMGGLKVLQGDESVVREAEVRMGMKATSIFDGLMNDLQKLQSGKSLQPSQRQAMINTIKVLTDLSRQQYMNAAAPILEQGRMEGIDQDILLSGSLSGANKPSESQTLTTNGAPAATKKVVGKQYSQSRNQTKIIFSDGTEEIVDGRQ